MSGHPMGDFHVEDPDPLALYIPTLFRGIRRKLKRRRDWKDLEREVSMAERLVRLQSAAHDSDSTNEERR